MIGRDELAESARYQDALSEEHGWEEFCKVVGVEPMGLHYIAQQRALRMAMLLDGQDPRLLSRTEKTAVTLSDRATDMMPNLAALAMDGIVIGLHAARKSR